MVEEGTISLALAIVFLGLWGLIWAVCLLGWRVANTRYNGKQSPSRLSASPKSGVPGVTIIRPICGLDNNLYNALESTMKLEYPRYEVIFAFQHPDDEAIPVVRMIMEKYPKVSTRLNIDDAKIGVNPKINNLIGPFTQASYDLLWVIDSTIAVQPGSLARAVEAFTGVSLTRSSFETDLESTPLISDDLRRPPSAGDVGLVHHVPLAVVYQKTWGSLIEQAFLNTTHAKMYLAINAVGLESCVVGKSNLYSRANIASLTSPAPSLKHLPDPPRGLAGFSPFLAEDNMIALSLWHELNLKHAMTGDVALDFLGALSVRQYIERRARWLRVRKRMVPLAAFLIEPFTESILCGIYGSWALWRLFGISIAPVFAAHMAAWLFTDLSVRHALSKNVRDIGPPFSIFEFVLAWTAREVLTLPVWLYGITSSDVVWRGKRYRIIGSGEAICLDR